MSAKPFVPPDYWVKARKAEMPPEKLSKISQFEKVNPPGSAAYNDFWSRVHAKRVLSNSDPVKAAEKTQAALKRPGDVQPDYEGNWSTGIVGDVLDTGISLPGRVVKAVGQRASDAGTTFKQGAQWLAQKPFDVAASVMGSGGAPAAYLPPGSPQADYKEVQHKKMEPAEASGRQLVQSFKHGLGVSRSDETEASPYQIQLEQKVAAGKILTAREKEDLSEMHAGRRGGAVIGGTGAAIAQSVLPMAGAGGKVLKAGLGGLVQGGATLIGRNIIDPAQNWDDIKDDLLYLGQSAAIPAGFVAVPQVAGLFVRKGKQLLNQAVGPLLNKAMAQRVGKLGREAASTTGDLGKRIAAADSLLEEADDYLAKGVAKPKQVQSWKNLREKLHTERVSELLDKASDEGASVKDRAEAIRKLRLLPDSNHSVLDGLDDALAADRRALEAKGNLANVLRPVAAKKQEMLIRNIGKSNTSEVLRVSKMGGVASPPKPTQLNGGAETIVTVAGRDPLPVKFRIVDADELIPSNDPHTLSEDPRFNKDLQGRVYDLTIPGNEGGKIVNNASNLKPENMIDAGKSAESGAPIITLDGHVASGNGRTLSYLRAHQTGKEGVKKYVGMLRSELGSGAYGDPAQLGNRVDEIVASGGKPLLVRQLPLNSSDPLVLEAAPIWNSQTSARGNSAVQSGVLAASVKNKNVWESFAPPPGQSLDAFIKTKAGGDALKSLAKNLNNQNVTEFFDGLTGDIYPDALPKIKNAILSWALGPEVMNSLIHAPKTLIKSLENSAGELVALKKSLGGEDLLDGLRKAIVKGRNLEVGLDQLIGGDLFGASSPLSSAAMKILYKFKNNGSALRDGLSKLRQEIPQEAADMFGNSADDTARLRKEAIVKQADTLFDSEFDAASPDLDEMVGGGGQILRASVLEGGGVLGHQKAAELDAQAEAETDPEKKRQLHQQANMWRLGSDAAMLGGAYAGLRVINPGRGGGGMAEEVGSATKNIWDNFKLPDWVQKNQVQGYMNEFRNSGGDEIRAGVKTLMGSDAITKETKEALADLVENGDPSVIKDVISHGARLESAFKDMKRFGDVNDPEGLLNAANSILGKNHTGEKAAQDVVDRIVAMKQITKVLQESGVSGELRAELLDTQSRLAMKYIEKGSKAGQLLNAHLLVKKLSPEGLVVWAQKVLADVDPKLKLSHDAQVKILEHGERLAVGDIQALEGVRAIIKGEVPSTLWQKMASARYLAMLSNPATHIKNVLGNTSNAILDVAEGGLASVLDKGVSKITKIRSTMGPNAGLRLKATAGSIGPAFKRAWKDEKSVLQTGVTLNDQGVAKYSEAMGGAGGTFKGVGKYPEKIIQTGLQAPDEVTFNQAFIASLADQLEVAAHNAGMKWKAPKDFYNKAFPGGDFNPKAVKGMLPIGLKLEDNILQEAIDAGKRATFTDENIVSNMAKGIRDKLDMVGVGERGAKLKGSRPELTVGGKDIYRKDVGLGSAILPFTGVPGAITNKIGQHVLSPAAFIANVGKLVKETRAGAPTVATQKAMVDSLAKVITAGGLAGLSYKLYDLGIIAGKPDAKGPKAANEAQGRLPGAINFSALGRVAQAQVRGGDVEAAAAPVAGDVHYKPDFADPLYPLVAGIAGGLSNRDDPSKAHGVLDDMLAIGGGVADAVEDKSFLRGLNNLFSGQGVGSGLIETAKDYPSSFIPNILARLASATDNTKRETDTAPGGDMVGKAMAKVPGLRQMLPEMVDFFGDEKTYDLPGNTFLAAAMGMLNPGQLGIEKARPEVALADKLTRSTGDESYPPDIQKRLTGGVLSTSDGKFKITGDQAAELQRIIGAKVRDAYKLEIKNAETFPDSRSLSIIKKRLDKETLNIVSFQRRKFAADNQLQKVETK